jgi:selenide,water dikinase
MSFDLLTTVEYGGCSAKIPARQLAEALDGLPRFDDENLLVDIDTHDDAGVYRIREDLALIQTTDFFPPVCSDPFEFGQIAAANSLSDIYAMGGRALTALNIVLFPKTRIPLEVLREILRGGAEKVHEAGAVIVGGHTIDDYPPKYGLAATGIVHPSRVKTNAGARPGDVLVLTKPIGTGIIVAGQRIGEADRTHYQVALDTMKHLNAVGSEAMQEHETHGATDITGFGLLGHCLKMAQASGVTIEIDASKVPLLEGVYQLADLGCLPGACFRNQEFVEDDCWFAPELDYSLKMILLDAQTSGGLLMAVASDQAGPLLQKLREGGYPHTAAVGIVLKKETKALRVH